ncbi:MAG: permease-like cell division protein FtsX [Candidatus Bruticola sp.]
MKTPPKSGFIDISPQLQQMKLDPSGSRIGKSSTNANDNKENGKRKKSAEKRPGNKPDSPSKSSLKEAELGKKNDQNESELQSASPELVIESVPEKISETPSEADDNEEKVIVRNIPVVERVSSRRQTKVTTVDEVLDEEDLPPKKRRGPSGGYYVECFLREVLTNMRHNPMMSIASISTVMILALILGFFVIIIANLESLADELAGEMQIKVYMSQNFEESQINSFKASAYDIGHVVKVNFVPKDEAFKKLRKRLNAKLDLDDLDSNPLPDAFEIPVDDPSFLEPVAHKLSQIDNVATVDYGREEAQKLMKLNHIIRLVGIIILVMLFASSLLIISNTIRLTVFARRKEIDIMQLVGAADWFIRWPFILEGVTQGAIGAATASVLIDVSYRIVVPQLQKSISFLPILAPGSIMPYLNIGLITMGCLVGALGSFISVNRYLRA